MGNLATAETELNSFIQSRLGELKLLNEQRIENWKQSLVDFSDLKGRNVQSVLGALLQETSKSSESSTLAKVANVKPSIEQEIRNTGDRLVGQKSSRMNGILDSVIANVAPDIA